MCIRYEYTEDVFIQISLHDDPTSPNYIWVTISPELTAFLDNLDVDSSAGDMIADLEFQDAMRQYINEFFDEYIMEAKASLERTPDLLPVLKEAGVVDSGGAGYICIIEGMIKLLNGEEINKDFNASAGVTHSNLSTKSKADTLCYCTEFILNLSKVEKPKQKVQSLADFLY